MLRKKPVRNNVPHQQEDSIQKCEIPNCLEQSNLCQQCHRMNVFKKEVELHLITVKLSLLEVTGATVLEKPFTAMAIFHT